MAVAPCGVVVVMGVVASRSVAVTIVALRDAAVAVVASSLKHVITTMALPSRSVVGPW
jgi:hypothetical protein